MKQADLKLLRLMRTRGHAPAIEKAAMSISKTGENGYLWFGIGLAGAALDRKRRRQWLATALLGPLAIGFNFGIKLIVRRERPNLEGLPPLGGAPSSLSFPSAHATASFAAATAMSRFAPELKLALFGAAAVMAVTRPYLGMHYPSDVAAGAVLGTAVGALIPLPKTEDPNAPYDF
ncbi:MAG: phosphatase PAP2 family protein [Solirubrobacterales bacterium]|nr:phosphatase PAP2 family protein [Solirubrobacterales bacterium]